MHDPQRDPFFAGLKVDIQEGVDAIDRGETVPADDVWAHFERRIVALPKDASDWQHDLLGRHTLCALRVNKSVRSTLLPCVPPCTK